MMVSEIKKTRIEKFIKFLWIATICVVAFLIYCLDFIGVLLSLIMIGVTWLISRICKAISKKYKNTQEKTERLSTTSSIESSLKTQPYIYDAKYFCHGQLKDFTSSELESYVSDRKNDGNKSQGVPDVLRPIIDIPEPFLSREAGIQDFIEEVQDGTIQKKAFSAISDEKTLSVSTGSNEVYFYRGAVVPVSDHKFIIIPFTKCDFIKSDVSFSMKFSFCLDIKNISFNTHKVVFDNEQTIDFIIACTEYCKQYPEKIIDYTSDMIIKKCQEIKDQQEKEEEKRRLEEEKERQAKERKEAELLSLRNKSTISRNAYDWVIKNREKIMEIRNDMYSTSVKMKQGEDPTIYSLRWRTKWIENRRKRIKEEGEIFQHAHNLQRRTNDEDAIRIYQIFIDEFIGEYEELVNQVLES